MPSRSLNVAGTTMTFSASRVARFLISYILASIVIGVFLTAFAWFGPLPRVPPQILSPATSILALLWALKHFTK